MNLDVPSLNVALMAALIALGVSLSVLMAGHGSPAARQAVGSLLLQAFASALALQPGYTQPQGWPLVLTSVSLAASGASLSLLASALALWLGLTINRYRLAAVALALPVGYVLLAPVMELRTAWSNTFLALQVTWTCSLLVRPGSPETRHWRLVLLVSLLAIAGATAWRGAAAALTPERYLSYLSPHPANVAGPLLLIGGVIGATVALMVAWRDEADRELRRLAQTDGLTQLLNRRAFQDRAARLWAAAQRHGLALGVMVIDVDHFKRINDARGHAVGDDALRLIARVLHDTVRSEDLICRWGGEEFCVLFAQDGDEAATRLDARLRDALRAQAQPLLGFGLDFSAGTASIGPGDASLSDLIRRADEALYVAKREGRGRLAGALAA